MAARRIDGADGRLPVRTVTGGPIATVMLRPEQLVVTELSNAERHRAVGTVTGVEFLGSDVLLTVELSGHSSPIVVRQNGSNPPAVHTKVEIDVLGAAVAYEQSVD